MDRPAANSLTSGAAEGPGAPGRPLLSVITPVLDGERFLPACMESVVRAARLMGGGIEHIIADGGSRDGTVALAMSALRDPGSPVVRVIPGPDRGQSHAVNRAAAGASGRWIAWLNADDRYVPEGIAAVAGVLARSAASVVVGRCRFVDASGATVFAPMPPDPVEPEAFLRPLSGWFAGRCIVQPEAFVSGAAWRASGGLDESNDFTMDHDLWLRLSLAGAAFETVDVLVAEQLAHPGQKTADNAAVASSILRTCRRVLERAPVRFGGERGAIARELERLGDKLRAYRGLGSTPARHRLEPGTDAALDELRPWMLGRTLGPVGLMGYRADDLPVWLKARAASLGTAVIGAAPPSARVGLMIAHAPTLRHGPSGAAMVLGSLRPGGVAVLAGEPTEGVAPGAGSRLMKELAGRITMPGAHLVDGVSDDELSAGVELLSAARVLGALPAGIERRICIPCPAGVHPAILRITGLESREPASLEVWERRRPG